MFLLPAERSRPVLQLGQLLAELGGVLQRLPEAIGLLFQLGKLAGLVEPAAVLPGPQPLVGLGPGHVLLSGGDQGGNALFQLLALAHSKVCLAEIDRAVKDLPADPGEGLSQILPGEAGDG